MSHATPASGTRRSDPDWVHANAASDANAPGAGPTRCLTREIYLAAGNYLWEGYQVKVNRTPGGDYYNTLRQGDQLPPCRLVPMVDLPRR